jgi:hypothetical protein
MHAGELGKGICRAFFKVFRSGLIPLGFNLGFGLFSDFYRIVFDGLGDKPSSLFFTELFDNSLGISQVKKGNSSRHAGQGSAGLVRVNAGRSLVVH